MVPVEAFSLALSIESRGGQLAVDDGDLVVDGPSGFLTDDDRRALARWKAHLIALVLYHAPEVIQ